LANDVGEHGRVRIPTNPPVLIALTGYLRRNQLRLRVLHRVELVLYLFQLGEFHRSEILDVGAWIKCAPFATVPLSSK
jgi:hypothetical protein